MDSQAQLIGALYSDGRHRALAAAHRVVRSRADAEDIVQSVFARLLVAGLRFDGRSSAERWLRRVVVNASISELRARRRAERLEWTPEDRALPDELVATSERRAQFLRALATLPERYRAVISLRDLRGLSYPEIARCLNIPEGTVKSTLSRGRRRLARALGIASFDVSAPEQPHTAGDGVSPCE